MDQQWKLLLGDNDATAAQQGQQQVPRRTGLIDPCKKEHEKQSALEYMRCRPGKLAKPVRSPTTLSNITQLDLARLNGAGGIESDKRCSS